MIEVRIEKRNYYVGQVEDYAVVLRLAEKDHKDIVLTTGVMSKEDAEASKGRIVESVEGALILGLALPLRKEFVIQVDTPDTPSGKAWLAGLVEPDGPVVFTPLEEFANKSTRVEIDVILPIIQKRHPSARAVLMDERSPEPDRRSSPSGS